MANANNADNVGVGSPAADGAIWIADEGTAVPDDLMAALPEAYSPFGYVSDDGVTISEDGDSNELTAWGGKTVKVIKTKFKETAAFTPIEINETVLREQYGKDNVATSTKTDTSKSKTYKVIVAKHKGVTLPNKVLIIKTCPTDSMMVVYVAKRAQLTERGDLSLNGSDAQGREMTYTCNADDESTTITSYTYILQEGA